jgi:hypothetical protein
MSYIASEMPVAKAESRAGDTTLSPLGSDLAIAEKHTSDITKQQISTVRDFILFTY